MLGFWQKLVQKAFNMLHIRKADYAVKTNKNLGTKSVPRSIETRAAIFDFQNSFAPVAPSRENLHSVCSVHINNSITAIANFFCTDSGCEIEIS